MRARSAGGSAARRTRQGAGLLAILAAVSLLAAPCAMAQDSAPGGAEVFAQAHCDVCHGKLGAGGAGPAFEGNRMLGVGDYVVAQIMIGRGIMPAFADKLTDDQIAAVATYIRNSWGNDFGPVTTAEASHVRSLLDKQGALSHLEETAPQ